MADRPTLRHHDLMLADGAPACILRWPGEAKSPLRQPQETPPADVPPAPSGSKFLDDAELRREAERQWREWMPTRHETTRPQLRSILKRLRNVHKATMPKPGPKELQTRALPHTRTNQPAPVTTKKTPAAPVASEKSTTTPTAKPEANQETAMAKTAKKKTAKTAAPKTAAAKTNGGVRPGSKLEIIAKLLTRPEGCTSAEVCKATGWAAVSVPPQAKAAGLKLTKKKEDGVTRYFGK